MVIRASSKRGSGIYIAIIATIVLLTAALFAGYHFINSLFQTKTRPVNLETISGLIDIDFPSDTDLIHSLGIQRCVDFEIYAEIGIDRKDIEPFIAALKKKPGIILSRKDRMYLTNSLRNWRKDVDIPEWWNPDSSQKFIACYNYMPLLLISLDDPNKVVVWVHWDTDGPPSSMRRKQ